MSHRTLPKLLSLLCMCCVAGGAWAQGNLAHEYKFTPKPGMTAALLAALRAHSEWRMQNGDPWAWSVYEVATGEEMGTILARSGEHTWADFDAYEASFALQGSIHFGATVTPLLESITSSISMVDTTITNWPDDAIADDYTLFQIVNYHLKPSRVQQFIQSVKRIHDAIVQEDYPLYYAFVSPVVGESGPSMTLVVPASSWSGFEDPDQPLDEMMIEFYGAEEAASIFTEFGDCYTAVDSRVLRLRPEISVIPEPGS